MCVCLNRSLRAYFLPQFMSLNSKQSGGFFFFLLFVSLNSSLCIDFSVLFVSLDSKQSVYSFSSPVYAFD